VIALRAPNDSLIPTRALSLSYFNAHEGWRAQFKPMKSYKGWVLMPVQRLETAILTDIGPQKVTYGDLVVD
jgi:hypothetical protein